MKRVLTMLLTAMVCLAPSYALAANYEIVDYLIEANVQADGAAQITETLTYDFDGDYNGILSALDVGDVSSLEGLTLFVDDHTQLRRVDVLDDTPNTYVAQKNGDMVEVRAYAPGHAGMRRFRYEYRMTGMAQRYQDAARLNYKLIGVNNPEGLERATVRVTLPGAVIDAWAHGVARTSQVVKAGRQVEVSGLAVEPGQFVELDVLFDEAALAQAPVIGQPIVDEARALEKQLAQQEAEADARSARNKGFFKVGILGGSAAFAAWFMLLLKRQHAVRGYKRKREKGIAGDFAQLAALPAAMGQLLKQNQVDTDGLAGTILELARAGLVAIKPPEGDGGMGFVRTDKASEGLEAHQALVLEWLFSGGNTVCVSHWNAGKDYAQAHAFEQRLGAYRDQVKEDAVARGLQFAGEGKLILTVVLMAVSAIVLCVLAGVADLWWMIPVIVVAAGLMWWRFASLRVHTDAGDAALDAIDQFIERMGKEQAPDSAALLPLAVALGLMDEMDVERGQDAAREFDYNSAMPWLYMGWRHDVYWMRRDLRETHRHNESVPDPSASHGSGSGGASSGGGGGGGGHGAW